MWNISFYLKVIYQSLFWLTGSSTSLMIKNNTGHGGGGGGES